MNDIPVRMYTISTCAHCRAAKRFLVSCTVRYEFKDIDLLEEDERNAIMDDIRKLNPSCSVPTIVIGDKVIVGFREKEIREALGIE